MRPLVVRAVLGLLIATPAGAQTYAGSYAARGDQGEQTVVTLQQEGAKVTGTIVGKGPTVQLEGMLEGEAVVGAVTDEQHGRRWFEARFADGLLHLTLFGAGADGQPDRGQATTLVFARAGTPVDGTAAPPPAADPWIGTFAGDGLAVQLDAGGDQYTGSVDVAGQRFPLTARAEGDSLVGTFGSGDAAFPMTLRPDGLGFVLVSEGMGYPLRRTDGGGPAGPAGVGDTGIDDGTSLGQEWAQFLAGKKASPSGIVDTTAAGQAVRGEMHLCADGRLITGGPGSVPEEEARWRVITRGDVVGIEVHRAGGKVDQHHLAYRDGETLVDGEPWLIAPSELCAGN